MSKGKLARKGLELTAEQLDAMKRYLMGKPKQLGGKVDDTIIDADIIEESAADAAKEVDPLKPFMPKAGIGAGIIAPASTLGDSEADEPVPPVEELKPVVAEEPKPPVEGKKKKTKKEIIPVPKSVEEEKLVLDSINSNLTALGELKDPPITAGDLREKALEDLKGARNNREQKLETLALVEKMIAAITKYAAASEGLKRGLDMSNAMIERTDWDRKIDRVYAKYKLDVNDLVDKYGKEDKAKSEVDTKRSSMVKSTQDLKRDLARLKDVRAREAARMREAALRRQEERGYRDERLAIQRDANDIRRAKVTSEAEAAEIASRFTDDPATAREIANAALAGEKALKAALNRSGVADKIKPEELAKYRKERMFGLLDPKLDMEQVQTDVLEDLEGKSQFPVRVTKGSQVATVSNAEELKEALAEGWSR